MPEPSRWDEISRLVSEARTIPPPQRGAFLESSTTDPDIRAEVQSLLQVRLPEVDVLEGTALDFVPVEASPAAASPQPQRLVRNDRLAGRFEVRSFLGRGGMGEVYAVQDLELGEVVALKLLHPDLAGQPGFLERFRREIRLARKISHPNVAKVYDLGQDLHHPDGPFYFYVLELLEGPTLAQRLRKEEPLSAEEAMQVALQICAGLAAVHAAGILHRDLKPANVILTAGRAVVTDFGLATAIPGNAAQTTSRISSLLLGTPGYIAPEQWAGRPASPQADIYSLGIVLHELITGRHPTPAIGPLPAVWDKAVRKCLEVDAVRRWKSAAEVSAALQSTDSSRRRFSYLLAGTAAAVATGFGLRHLYRNRTLKAGARLLVATASNSIPDPRWNALHNLLRLQLEQSTQFNLLSAAEIATTLTSMMLPAPAKPTAEQFREVAWRRNASAVLFSSVALIGATPSITLQLEWRGSQPQDPADRQTEQFVVADISGLNAAIRQGVQWVRRQVGDASVDHPVYNRLPEQITTPSWEALVFLGRAEEAAYTQNHQAALLDLDSALRLDPGFTFAAMRKADILNSMGQDLASMQAWQTAMALLAKRPASRREELRTLGMYAFDSFNFPDSEAHFEKLAYEYPNDARSHFFRSTPMMLDERFRELLPVLERAVELDPDYFSPYTALGQIAAYLQDRSLLQTAASRLTALRQPQFAHLCETSFGWAGGDPARVLSSARQLQQMASPRFALDGHLQEGHLYAEAGRYDRAAACYAQAETAPLQASVLANRCRGLFYLGWMQLQMSQPRLALETALKLEDTQASVASFGNAAILHASAGNIAGAKRLLGKLEDCPQVTRTVITIDIVRAEIAKAAGDSVAAQSSLRRALARLPKLGCHRILDADSAGSGVEAGNTLAAVPQFLWLHNHFYRPGIWAGQMRSLMRSHPLPPLQHQRTESLLQGLTRL